MKRMIGKTKLVLVEGDIPRQDVDAIVNAANPGLMGGGGVDGAIHRAGGPQILEECKVIVARQGRCPAGGAVVTGGGRLKASHVIHAVGPIWRGGDEGEDDLLRSAYVNSLRQALSVEGRGVALSFLSNRAYGFPIERAAPIAFEAVSEFVRDPDRLEGGRFVPLGPRDPPVYAPLVAAV